MRCDQQRQPSFRSPPGPKRRPILPPRRPRLGPFDAWRQWVSAAHSIKLAHTYIHYNPVLMIFARALPSSPWQRSGTTLVIAEHSRRDAKIVLPGPGGAADGTSLKPVIDAALQSAVARQRASVDPSPQPEGEGGLQQAGSRPSSSADLNHPRPTSIATLTSSEVT